MYTPITCYVRRKLKRKVTARYGAAVPREVMDNVIHDYQYGFSLYGYI